MEKRMHIALIEAAEAHRKSCVSEFTKMNLTAGQPKVLSRLRQQEGYLQKELAALCHVEPATMTVLLANMERRGLIRKETAHVSGGKRAFRIYLTELGRGLAEQISTVVDQAEEKSYEGFSEAEKEQFVALLERFTNNLKTK